jgi:phosphoribosylanthranilate isomerase
MWIKICGMTTHDAVAAALDAGADAIGFVFADSVRKVSTELASRLAISARGRIPCVAVTRCPSQQAIDEILSGFKPDILQTDAIDLPLLELPSQLELLPVLRGEPPESGALPPRLLFEGRVSGAGMTCDWSAAQRVARRSQLILAGGLSTRNVADAIADVMPFGVDVSSGVESTPGVKSPLEIVSFVLTTRRAASKGASNTSDLTGTFVRSGSTKSNLAVSQSGETAEQSRGGRASTPTHEDPL